MRPLEEEFPIEESRVREVLGCYKALGPTGAFSAMNIEIALEAARNAYISSDLVRIIWAYDELKQIKYQDKGSDPGGELCWQCPQCLMTEDRECEDDTPTCCGGLAMARVTMDKGSDGG